VEYDFESGESGGNDDGGESGENELWARWIIGTWETTQAYIGGEWLDIPSDTDMYATMSFYADGSYYGDSELFGTGWGTYTLSGDTVNTYYDGVLYYTYTIKSMTETSAEVTMAYGTANIPIRLRKQ
jgi:hypothetical protein